MDVHGILLKQQSDNVRSCSGRICPRPKQLSSARNCSASCSRTANTANHATALHSVTFATSYSCRPEDKMWSCSMNLICLASHSSLCFIHIYHPTDYLSILHHQLSQFCVSCNAFLSPWTIIKCNLHISNTTHYIRPFCKNLKVSLSLINEDKSSFISDFSCVALYPLDVYIRMPSL